jgi:hypothetical protein
MPPKAHPGLGCKLTVLSGLGCEARPPVEVLKHLLSARVHDVFLQYPSPRGEVPLPLDEGWGMLSNCWLSRLHAD